MPLPPPETQSLRWFKYGGNVVLTTLVVVLLALGAGYIAQRHPARVDTTVAGVHSLKPQTLAVLGELRENVRIVSIYPRAGDKDERDYVQPVLDMLDLYTRNSSGRVSVDHIDPETEQAKLDALTDEVTNRYSAELTPYKEFLSTAFPKFVADFKAFAGAEAEKIAALPLEGVTDPDLAQTLFVARASVRDLTDRVDRANERIERRLKQRIPDYRTAASDCIAGLEDLDLVLGKVVEDFRGLGAASAKTPTEIATYAAQALPRFEAGHKLVKDALEKAKTLGELKLDSLRASIRRQSILVMGEKEMRVLGFADVWQAPDDLRSLVNQLSAGEKPRLRFAGEQQISTALRSLAGPDKRRVIFVRPSGGPLATSMFRQAPFATVARRLREVNFEIVEKDISGQFAMQAQMQGMPVTEASDEQMRDRSAVWIVFSIAPPGAGSNPMNPMGGGGDVLAGKLREHLEEGGSALVLFESDADTLASALDPWGVKARTDAVVVKDVPTGTAPNTADIVARAEFMPYIFTTNDWGTSPVTAPVGALSGLLIAPVPVSYTSADGRTGTPFLPVPRSPRTWGETDTAGLFPRDGSEPKRPEFGTGDVPNDAANPLYQAVAVQKKDRGRLVVIGSASSFSNGVLSLPDPELERRGYLTPRFPGNPELFVNATYWAAGMDTMLAISPAAMEVNRVRPIPAGQLSFIKWGVVVGGLPAVVLLAGVFVYLKRRD